MALDLIAPPLLEPVSLADFKQYARISLADTSQDGVILDMLTAARVWAEVYTQRRFVQQTWRLSMDFFPGYIDMKLAGQRVSSPFVSGANAVLVGIRYAVMLPYPPVQAIDQFVYLNANGSTTVMNPATDYVTDVLSNPARLTPPFGQMWPVARVVVNAVQVDYIVGYAKPILVSSTGNSRQISANYAFLPTDIGRPITIRGAAASGYDLTTIITGISSPPGATIRDPVTTPVTNADALLVNNPGGQPAHWSLVRSAIKTIAYRWCELRLPDEGCAAVNAARALLGPMRDLRV